MKNVVLLILVLAVSIPVFMQLLIVLGRSGKWIFMHFFKHT